MVRLKNKDNFIAMFQAGKLAGTLLKIVEPHVKPGVSTEELNRICHEYTIQNRAIPAPLHYKSYRNQPPFPKSICTSVNDVVCHGIPSASHILQDGDIINIDVTVILDGWHGDCSRTFYVGTNIPAMSRHVTEVAEEATARGIAKATMGNHIGDIGFAIQSYGTEQNVGVVRDFCGHGIGKIFHEPDFMVANYGTPKTDKRIVKGMTFTVEPMINGGGIKHKMLADSWTAKTIDGQPSAQFEHTLGVWDGGICLFTALPDDPIAKRVQELGTKVYTLEEFLSL
jgi:methionyl aminopeptidase